MRNGQQTPEHRRQIGAESSLASPDLPRSEIITNKEGTPKYPVKYISRADAS